MQKNAKWLEGVLNANGFTAADLQKQTGLAAKDIQAVMQDEPASEMVWNTILSTVNAYPALDYPSADILRDLAADIESEGPQGECIVYYGVSAGDLIFTSYMLLSDMQLKGAQASPKWQAQLPMHLEQAQVLFTKQNCTLQD